MIDYSKATLNEGVIVIEKIKDIQEGALEMPTNARSETYRGQVIAANAKIGDRKIKNGDIVVFNKGAGGQDIENSDIFYFHIDNIYLVL